MAGSAGFPSSCPCAVPPPTTGTLKACTTGHMVLCDTSSRSKEAAGTVSSTSAVPYSNLLCTASTAACTILVTVPSHQDFAGCETASKTRRSPGTSSYFHQHRSGIGHGLTASAATRNTSSCASAMTFSLTASVFQAPPTRCPWGGPAPTLAGYPYSDLTSYWSGCDNPGVRNRTRECPRVAANGRNTRSYRYFQCQTNWHRRQRGHAMFALSL